MGLVSLKDPHLWSEFDPVRVMGVGWTGITNRVLTRFTGRDPKRVDLDPLSRKERLPFRLFYTRVSAVVSIGSGTPSSVRRCPLTSVVRLFLSVPLLLKLP